MIARAFYELRFWLMALLSIEVYSPFFESRAASPGSKAVEFSVPMTGCLGIE